MLTETQIRRLLDLLAEEEVAEPTSNFPYRITRRGFGYKDGPDGGIQAVLSIMLQAKSGK